MSDWPEGVVERVARAIYEAYYPNTCFESVDEEWDEFAAGAKAVLDALGGERVHIDKISGRVFRDFTMRHAETTHPALLIPLDGGDG